MAEGQMYLTPYCPYCVRAKALLQRKGVPFQEFNVEGDPEKRAWLAKATGMRTVPQIFIDGRHIGGSDDMHLLDRQGGLDPLLRA